MTGRPETDTATPSNTGNANGGASAELELRWPEREGAVAYRVVGRDPEHDRLALDTGSLDEAHYLLSDEQVLTGRPLRLRIDVSYGDGEWTAYGPAFVFPAIEADEDVWWLHWPDDGAGLYRVLVTDHARHETVVDEIVLGTRFPLRRALLRPASEIRWRARPWRTDHWDDAEARALPFDVLISEPEPAAVPPKPADPRLLLLFTVDTEGGLHQMRHPDPPRTIDQLVFGDHGAGESLGIGLQMDLLEQFGFRGTFFVDVLLEYTFGRDALERTVERSPTAATRSNSMSTTSTWRAATIRMSRSWPARSASTPLRSTSAAFSIAASRCSRSGWVARHGHSAPARTTSATRCWRCCPSSGSALTPR